MANYPTEPVQPREPAQPRPGSSAGNRYLPPLDDDWTSHHRGQDDERPSEPRDGDRVGGTARSAAMRKESRGLHYTTDYPDKMDHVEETYM